MAYPHAVRRTDAERLVTSSVRAPLILRFRPQLLTESRQSPAKAVIEYRSAGPATILGCTERWSAIMTVPAKLLLSQRARGAAVAWTATGARVEAGGRPTSPHGGVDSR